MNNMCSLAKKVKRVYTREELIDIEAKKLKRNYVKAKKDMNEYEKRTKVICPHAEFSLRLAIHEAYVKYENYVTTNNTTFCNGESHIINIVTLHCGATEQELFDKVKKDYDEMLAYEIKK